MHAKLVIIKNYKLIQNIRINSHFGTKVEIINPSIDKNIHSSTTNINKKITWINICRVMKQIKYNFIFFYTVKISIVINSNLYITIPKLNGNILKQMLIKFKVILKIPRMCIIFLKTYTNKHIKINIYNVKAFKHKKLFIYINNYYMRCSCIKLSIKKNILKYFYFKKIETLFICISLSLPQVLFLNWNQILKQIYLIIAK